MAVITIAAVATSYQLDLPDKFAGLAAPPPPPRLLYRAAAVLCG